MQVGIYYQSDSLNGISINLLMKSKKNERNRMKMKWFKDIKNIEQLRKKYKELLRVYHPDNGGNVSDMQEIDEL